MADLEQELGRFIREQNPFTREMRLPPHWQTDERIVTFPSAADVWATLLQDPSSAVSKVVRISTPSRASPRRKPIACISRMR